MRHRKGTNRLSRNSSLRKATLKSLVASLVLNQQIKTTHAMAKEASKLAERLITLGKNGNLHKRRQAFDVLRDRTLVNRLFNDIAPLFKERKGGYTRIIRLANRHGDGAQMALLELTEKKAVEAVKTKKAKPEKASKEEPPKEAAAPVKEEKPKEEKPKKPSVAKAVEDKEVKKEEKPKEEKPEEKTREDKRFLGGIRRLFKKKN